MREKTLLVKCDRCDTDVMLHLKKLKLENGAEMETYEDLPEGWLTDGKHDYCPNCARRYNEFRKEFFKYD